MTFLQKSYNEYNKVEKSTLVTTSYEGSDDEEELEAVSIINQNNNNAVSASHSESDEEQSEENCFNDDIDKEVKATPKSTINAKVIHTMK